MKAKQILFKSILTVLLVANVAALYQYVSGVKGPADGELPLAIMQEVRGWLSDDAPADQVAEVPPTTTTSVPAATQGHGTEGPAYASTSSSSRRLAGVDYIAAYRPVGGVAGAGSTTTSVVFEGPPSSVVVTLPPAEVPDEGVKFGTASLRDVSEAEDKKSSGQEKASEAEEVKPEKPAEKAPKPETAAAQAKPAPQPKPAPQAKAAPTAKKKAPAQAKVVKPAKKKVAAAKAKPAPAKNKTTASKPQSKAAPGGSSPPQGKKK